MKVIQKKIVFIVLQVSIVFIAFLAGFYVAESIFKDASKEISALNNFVRYEISRNIAASLKSGNVKDAKCKADLEASSRFDNIKECISNRDCAVYISSNVKSRTPEILTDTPLSFDYLQSIGGVRRCD